MAVDEINKEIAKKASTPSSLLSQTEPIQGTVNRRPPPFKTNKRFLHNTLRNAIDHNTRKINRCREIARRKLEETYLPPVLRLIESGEREQASVHLIDDDNCDKSKDSHVSDYQGTNNSNLTKTTSNEMEKNVESFRSIRKSRSKSNSSNSSSSSIRSRSISSSSISSSSSSSSTSTSSSSDDDSSIILVNDEDDVICISD